MIINSIRTLLNRHSGEQSGWGNAVHISLDVTRPRYADLLTHMECALTDKNYVGLLNILPALHEQFAENLQSSEITGLLFRDEVFDTTIASRVLKPSLADRYPDVLAPFNGKKKIGKREMDLNLDRDYPYIIEKMLYLTLADKVPQMISDPANALKHLQSAIEQNAKETSAPVAREKHRRWVRKAAKPDAHPA